MTKKHFISLADSIREMRAVQLRAIDDRDTNVRTWTTWAYQQTLNTLADFCQQQNPRFNRERWLAYIAGECGPNGGSVKPKTEHRPYRPKTGQPCSCRRGVQRDNCPECEGTGQRIDFAAIRNRS